MASLRPPPSSPPSSPLSVLSQSPSPPSPALDASKRYPSPTSSAATSGSASPIKPSDMSDSTDEIRVRTDGPPPSKRRRITAPPKPRTTAYVDLENSGEEEDGSLGRLLSALRKKKKIVVIAGAGISVSAGSTSPLPVKSRQAFGLLTRFPSSRLPLVDRPVCDAPRAAQAQGVWQASI